MNSLPWPDGAPVIPIATVRGTLDRLASIANRFPQDITLVPGLAMTEGEVASDPPPALEQITDEFGGIEVRGLPQLNLLVEDRTDVGPYTLLGAATSFYPLYETPEAAVVLTVGDDGAPGAVYGIGEDLDLRLLAPDLASYLERFADVLEQVAHALAGRDDGGESDEARSEAAEQLMQQRLVPADGPEIPLVAPEQVTGLGVDLPRGTIAVADLRAAGVGAGVDLIDADLPGDPLDLSVAWRESGRIVCIVTDSDTGSA